MAGSSTGTIFTVTTWGESHGPATGVVVDGCPAGIALSEADIRAALERRKSRGLASATPRVEPDEARILSGVFEGMTTGTPISILIPNADTRSGDYDRLRNVYRPGHGDIAYQAKYGVRDHRGGGRASGRETAARVAAGEVARRVLASAGIEVLGYTRSIGTVTISEPNLSAASESPAGGAWPSRAAVEESVLMCPDPVATGQMLALLDEVLADGDSIGGVVQVVARHVPAGLGEPVFEKLDASLAAALMSIGTVKAVEVGEGVRAATMRGSEDNDAILAGGYGSNHAGGILAGISDGADIVVRAHCKPIPSISIEQQTTTVGGEPTTVVVGGRHDVCVLPRIVPVAEAMVAITLADHLLRQRAQRGEVR